VHGSDGMSASGGGQHRAPRHRAYHCRLKVAISLPSEGGGVDGGSVCLARSNRVFQGLVLCLSLVMVVGTIKSMRNLDYSQASKASLDGAQAAPPDVSQEVPQRGGEGGCAAHGAFLGRHLRRLII
jgi:hypothetical protein